VGAHHSVIEKGTNAMSKGLPTFLKGFRDFVFRGNILELAIAFVVGLAFKTVVDSVTNNFISPIISVFGGNRFDGLGFRILHDNPHTYVDIAAILTAVINFLVIAAVLYFLVILPINKIRSRIPAPKPEEAGPLTQDTALLTEIRDLLRDRNTQV